MRVYLKNKMDGNLLLMLSLSNFKYYTLYMQDELNNLLSIQLADGQKHRIEIDSLRIKTKTC